MAPPVDVCTSFRASASAARCSLDARCCSLPDNKRSTTSSSPHRNKKSGWLGLGTKFSSAAGGLGGGIWSRVRSIWRRHASLAAASRCAGVWSTSFRVTPCCGAAADVVVIVVDCGTFGVDVFGADNLAPPPTRGATWTLVDNAEGRTVAPPVLVSCVH